MLVSSVDIVVGVGVVKVVVVVVVIEGSRIEVFCNWLLLCDCIFSIVGTENEILKLNDIVGYVRAPELGIETGINRELEWNVEDEVEIDAGSETETSIGIDERFDKGIEIGWEGGVNIELTWLRMFEVDDKVVVEAYLPTWQHRPNCAEVFAR